MSAALSHAAIFVPVAFVTAVLMELWAALLHGCVWHGPLYAVHRSHHEPRTGTFERNDLLALAHAPPAIALILWGCLGAEGTLREALYGVGIGMTAFGGAYLVVHDGLAHGRLPVSFLLRFKALRRVVRAHRVHHADTAGGAPYGLFVGPRELVLRAAMRQRLTRRGSTSSTSPPSTAPR